MDINLSWDLFVIVLFVVIVAYSLIIGRDNTLKVILGTYVSVLGADALGSIFGKYFASSPFMNLFRIASVQTEEQAIVFVKVMVFVALVILFAVKGAFETSTVDDRSTIVRILLNFIYAFMSASLIIVSILVFVSGVSFIGGGNPETSQALWSISIQSKVITMLVKQQLFIFFLPVLAFLIHSIYTKKSLQ